MTARKMCQALLVTWALLGGGMVFAQDTVDVIMSTSEGDVRIELYASQAPVTVENFLRYVDGGHYEGGSFYRTVTYENDNGNPKIEVIQGGLGNGVDAPFPPIAHEDTEATGVLHTDGVVSMARNGVGTASSEFFICLGDQPGLDKGELRNPDEQGFAAFGKVVDGMDVVMRIHQAPAAAPSYSEYTKGQIIEDPVQILTIRRAD